MNYFIRYIYFTAYLYFEVAIQAHTSTHDNSSLLGVRFRTGAQEMRVCKKDTDTVDPNQLELI